MHRRFVKLISPVLAIIMAMSLVGCMGDTDFSLESTGPNGGSESNTSTSAPFVRTEFDTVKYPYYGMLDEVEKDAYSLIYEELSAGNKKFECRVGINSDQLTRVVDSVLNDHPELFWIDNNYGYTFEPGTGNIRELTFTFFDFADTPEKLASAQTQFNSATLTVVTQALDLGTAVERELFIHDYICQNTVYDATGPYNQSAYSVLVLHKSVCAGYTRAFQHLMQKVGLTCYYVPGRTDGLDIQGDPDSPEDGSHSWNIVFIGGDYYNVDCLWDDTASETYGQSIYPFFNIPDESLLHHARIDMARSLPRCTATEYKYSNQFGPTIEAESIVFSDAG